MSTELNSLLHNQLGDILKRHLANRGEHTFAVDKAVQLVLPTIVAGILTHVNGSRDKAMSLYNKIMEEKSELHQAIEQTVSSGSISPSITALGQHFSSSIFGTQQAEVVAAHIGKESSVSDESANSLLASALPLVLAVFRRQAWSPAALYQILSNQSQWISKTLPSGIMIALGIGSTAGLSASVAALASTLSGYVATTSSALGASTATGSALAGVTGTTAMGNGGGFAWGKLLLWLILGALAIFGLRTCMSQNSQPNTAKPAVEQSQNQNDNNGAAAASDSANSDDNANAAASSAANNSANSDSDNSGSLKKSDNNHDDNNAANNTSAAKDINDIIVKNAEKNTANGAASAAKSADSNDSSDKKSDADGNSKGDGDSGSLKKEDEQKSSENQSDDKSSAAEANKAKTDSNITPAANESRVIAENGKVKFYFATGFSRIAKNADEAAQDAIAAGKAGKKLIISGFTDSTGQAKANENLSRKRAEAVKKFFVERGVDEKNIELRKPKNSVGAQGKNQEGRRVEVQIKD